MRCRGWVRTKSRTPDGSSCTTTGLAVQLYVLLRKATAPRLASGAPGRPCSAPPSSKTMRSGRASKEPHCLRADAAPERPLWRGGQSGFRKPHQPLLPSGGLEWQPRAPMRLRSPNRTRKETRASAARCKRKSGLLNKAAPRHPGWRKLASCPHRGDKMVATIGQDRPPGSRHDYSPYFFAAASQ